MVGQPINQPLLCKRNYTSVDLPGHCELQLDCYLVLYTPKEAIKELYSTSSQPYKSLHTGRHSSASSGSI